MAAKKKKIEPTQEALDRPRTPEQFRLALRRKTRIYYDIQELRLATQGRLLKKAPDSPIELHPIDIEKIQTQLAGLETVENNALKDLDEQLHEVSFYATCIEPQRKTKYRGLGPRMASVIISSFDIYREDTVSKMWAYAGLAPITALRCARCFMVLQAPDETGHPRHPKTVGSKCPLAGAPMPLNEVLQSGKQMRPVAGEKLHYNAWLRAKLCGVLASVLLRLNSPYRQYYDNYKQRWQQQNKGVSDAHRHAAAIRYMIKMLLLDIWKEWRAHEKLPVRGTYQEEFLKHTTSQQSVDAQIKASATPAPVRVSHEDMLIEELVKEENDGAAAE
jgi:hypothetical protein